MIVDKAIYSRGARHTIDGDISDAFDAARAEASRSGLSEEPGGCFVWIGLHEPTEEEFAHVRDELDLHPLAAEDAVSAHQRPKLERYDDTLFLVLKTLVYKDATSDIEVGEIMVFLGPDFVVTVRHGEGNPLGPVRRRLEADTALLDHGPAGVAYAICDQVVDTYGMVTHEVEVDIIELERAVFRPGGPDVTEDIYSLKREVLEFRRAVRPLAIPMGRIARGEVRGIDPRTKDYFRDVEDHVLRAAEQVDQFAELLTGTLAANMAQIQSRENEDMRKITAWVAVVSWVTMVGGIYGMNFTFMPELDWPLGYPFALVLMAFTSLMLYLIFKRRDWL